MKALNLHLAASKDDLRPQLQYIAIQSREKVSVTDAHIMIWGTFDDLFGFNDMDDHIAELLDNSIYIHKDEYKKIANKQLIGIADLDKDRKELRFLDYNLQEHIVRYETDIKYVDWERVIPTSMEDIDSIGVNMELMNRLYSICKTRDTKTLNFELHFHGNNKAIKFNGGNDSVSGINAIIMPWIFYS